MPGKRQYSITATEDMVPVLASYTPNKRGKPPTTHLAYLSCASCDNEVLGSNTISPFCSSCAGDMSPATEDTLEVTASEIEKEYKTIATCGECNTVVATRKDVLVAFDDKHIYCPTCAAATEIKADDDEDDSEDSDADNAGDDTGMSDTVNEDDSDNLFNNDEGEGSGDDTTSEDTSGDDTATRPESDDANSSKDDTSGEDTGGTTLNANLVKALSGKTGDIAVVASPDKSKWFLFVDNTPVASSSKDAASDNVKEMFDNDKFASAWNAATTDGITEDLLNDFGFVANNVDVPVDEAVKQNLEASIDEARQKFSLTAAEMRGRFDRCFGIAAVGINKQVFKKSNPVKTALIASLKNMRVRNAETLVTAAFNEHGEEYLDNISEKASELMDKSDETLDELAHTVDDAKYTVEKGDTAAPVKPEAAPLKLTTFPKQSDDSVDDLDADNANDDGKTELAASDNDDTLSKIERMFGGMRKRN